MKIKGLLLGMFACAALVACTNDDIVESTGGNENGTEVPAYVTLSFTAKTTGDGRAVVEDPTDPENTNITNAGTVNESNVKSLALLIGDEMVKVYDESALAAAFTAVNGVYTSNDPIKVTAGTKEIIVILNPTTAVAAAFATVNGAKEAIASGTFTGDTYAEAIAGVTGGTNMDAFMMGNREKVTVVATSANTETNPVIANVNVERAVAKIMFRTTTDNTYTVPITTEKTEHVSQEVGETAYYKATDQNGAEVWYTTADGVVTGVYSISGSTVTELTKWNGEGATPPAGTYYTLADGKELNYIKTTNTLTEDLTITLNGYLISNLQKTGYNVRHISTDGATGTAFGLLNGTNYLFDPFFTQKNAANVADEDFDFGALFFTPFADMDAATATFEAMPTGDDESTTTGDDRGVGAFMKYCFENAAVPAMQKHGYSTSITFKATAKLRNEPFEGYFYKNAYYKTEADLISSNPGVTASTEGVAHFADGICYYTAQIKHSDNGLEGTMGNMEFAIVRNNIYSLSVSALNKIGDATVDPDPTVDDETGDGYIKLSVTILPWVVRYNNIEF